MPIIERIVTVCCRYAALTVLAALLLTLGAGYYTQSHFNMNTDSEQLISAKVGWRQRELAFDKKFPGQSNLIAVVIDGQTPELAEAAAASLSARIAVNKALFPSVRRPDGGAFFDHNGLLFLPLADVQATAQQLFKAQPFLGALAADPSLRGIMDSLSTALLGVTTGQAKLADLDAPITRFEDSFSAAANGQVKFLSWRSLITGAPPRPEEIRRFIEVQPALDFDALEPGLKASTAIRDAAKALGLTPENGVNVRLTGDVPLSDEEFATLTDRAWLMGGAMLGGVLLTLWLALRSFKLIAAILATLVVGLAVTMAVGLLAVGVFNIISIAFIALFVGAGGGFRHPVCGALSQRAFPSTRSGHSALPYRAQRWRAAGNGGAGHRGGLFLIPAHRIYRRRGIGPCRWRGHDRRFSHQHHLAAGLADADEARRGRR